MSKKTSGKDTRVVETTCLNCKYEPTWSEPSKHPKYPSRAGYCKFPMPTQILPACCTASRMSIIMRYSDDSGVLTYCPCWGPKEKSE